MFTSGFGRDGEICAATICDNSHTAICPPQFNAIVSGIGTVVGWLTMKSSGRGERLHRSVDALSLSKRSVDVPRGLAFVSMGVGSKGGLMYEPWTLMTSSPYIWDIFKDCVRSGIEPGHEKHEAVEGDNAWKSAFYPAEMCDRVHDAIAKRLDPSFRKAWITDNPKKMKIEKTIVAAVTGEDIGISDESGDLLAAALAVDPEPSEELVDHSSLMTAKPRSSVADLNSPDEGLTDDDLAHLTDKSHSSSDESVVPTSLANFQASSFSRVSRNGPGPFSGKAHGVEPSPKADDQTSEGDSEASVKTIPEGGYATTALPDSDSEVGNAVATVDALALAAQKAEISAKLEALFLAARWLVDTGCGKDLISFQADRLYEDHWISVEQMIFGTANGRTKATEALKFSVPDIQDEDSKAYILASTPPVLSVGLRCVHKGYCFLWLAGKRPCMDYAGNDHYPFDDQGRHYLPKYRGHRTAQECFPNGAL